MKTVFFINNICEYVIPIEKRLIRLNYEGDIVYDRDSKRQQVGPLMGDFYCLCRP